MLNVSFRQPRPILIHTHTEAGMMIKCTCRKCTAEPDEWFGVGSETGPECLKFRGEVGDDLFQVPPFSPTERAVVIGCTIAALLAVLYWAHP